MLGRDLSIQHSWMLNGEFCESPQWLPTPVTAASRTSSAWLALSLEGGGLPKRRASGLIHLSTYLYRPIPSYTILCLSFPIYPHISIQFHASIHLSRYTVTIGYVHLPISTKMYSGELSGSRELRKNTLKTIIGSCCKPASWHCSHRCFILALKLHLRIRTMLPLRSRSSSAKFDACLAASTWKGQVAHGSTAEKGDAGNAGPVALRSWCWRFFDALSCVGIHALCKSREIKARQSAMNAVRLPDRIKHMTHQSI